MFRHAMRVFSGDFDDSKFNTVFSEGREEHVQSIFARTICEFELA
jgi:hypothetical protein